MNGDLSKSNKVKLIILTEDEDLTLIQTLIESSEIPINELEIYSYKGCSDIKTANILADFILKNNPSVKIVIHRDRDYHDEKEIESIINKYRNITYFFLTEGTDIETSFINSRHINFLYPEISIENAENLIHFSIEDSFIKSREKYLNTLSNKSLEKREGHKAAENLAIVEKNLKENPNRYIHGKTVLSNLKTKIQKEIQQNPNLYRPSPFISPPIFNLIKNEVWDNKRLNNNNQIEPIEEGILDIVISAEKDFKNATTIINSINRSIETVGANFRLGTKKINALNSNKITLNPSKTKLIVDGIASDLFVFTNSIKKDSSLLNDNLSYIILYYSKLIIIAKRNGEHQVYLNDLQILRDSMIEANSGLSQMLEGLKTVRALTTNFIKAQKDSINALEYLINTLSSFITLIDHID
ncbi:hypothetical protein [Emticicia soli]|uniref:DUF4347 domain-containing protein n=1 Tax=Emticicia soli TaxID=2027878 RepID=A0ABW5J386_9BACT